MTEEALNEVYEDMGKLAEECINFTASQRDMMAGVLKEKFQEIDDGFKFMMERIQNLEQALCVSVIALSIKAGKPMTHKGKVAFANSLYLDWEGDSKKTN